MAALLGYGLGYQFRSPEGPELVGLFLATHDFWSLLGVRPLIGRTFLPEEDRREAEAVALLPYGLWTRLYGGDPAIVGQVLPGVSFSVPVVGVLPPSFNFSHLFGTPGGDPVEDRIVLNLSPYADSMKRHSWPAYVFARLRSDVDAGQARQELETLSRDAPITGSGDLGAEMVAPPYRMHVQVVGVCADVRHEGPDRPIRPELYTALLQTPPSFGFLFVRFKPGAESNWSAVHGAVREVDPDLPSAGEPMRLDDVWSRGLLEERGFYTLCLTLFAVIACCLAAVGVFATVAFSVRQRFHEIGVRIALGAQKRHVLRAALGRTLAVTSAGLLMGCLGAFAFSRLLAAFLFQIEPGDPFTVFSALVLSVASCTLAAYLPARWALGISPTDVLKSQ